MFGVGIYYLYFMKKTIVSRIAFLFIFLAGMEQVFSQKADLYQCGWQEGPFPTGWEDLSGKMQADEKSALMYSVSNNDSSLFIYLLISDKATIQKVMRYGLTTWLNPDAKSKKSLGIEFPLAAGENFAPPARQMGQQQGDRKDMMMGLMAAKNKKMALIGFSGKAVLDTIQPGQRTGFNGHIDMPDREKILVSLEVPVSAVESAGRSAPDGLLGIGFETGYLDLNRQGMGQAAGGQQSQGSGGYGGGMYGGPPSGGGGVSGGTEKSSGKADNANQPDISELAKPTRLWINPVKLSRR
jgi:hypothetical protein